MVERFKRTKDSFVNKNRNISSKDYISLCYKQITINPSLQTRGSLDQYCFHSVCFFYLVHSSTYPKGRAQHLLMHFQLVNLITYFITLIVSYNIVYGDLFD